MALVRGIVSIFVLLSILNFDLFDFTSDGEVANLIDLSLAGRALVFRVLHPLEDAGPAELVSAVVELRQVITLYRLHADNAARHLTHLFFLQVVCIDLRFRLFFLKHKPGLSLSLIQPDELLFRAGDTNLLKISFSELTLSRSNNFTVF
jgi:hypothetical protein